MGAALIVPVVVVVMLAVIWVAFFSKKARDQAKVEQELPDEPYARREEELRMLREEHAAADPALTQHPARRP